MTLADEDLLRQFNSWPEKVQAEAASLLQGQIEKPPVVWYCPRGRACDGDPHEGVPYQHARSDQWPPEGNDWFVWLVMSGRGSGKTRTGSEWTRKMNLYVPAIALVARTGPDLRATMIEGEPIENGSGLIRACERQGWKHGRDFTWEPSKKEFTFPNGGKAFGYSAEEPDSLRGKQHGAAWLDEPAHMDLINEVWHMLKLGLRQRSSAGRARALWTSTPKPLPILKELSKKSSTRVVRVSTHVNLKNLDPSYAEEILSDYEGTRLGRQEIYGEILEDVEGALWDADMIAKSHDFDRELLEGVPWTGFDGQGWSRVVVAVDPAGSDRKRADMTGIIVIAQWGREFFVLEDATDHYTPDGWAKKVVRLYRKWGANLVVAEKNYGAQMVISTLKNQDENLPIVPVNSRRGKELRAEPVVALYEQGRVKHVGDLTALEEEQSQWVPSDPKAKSPNRIDAEVHGITYLMKAGRGQITKPPKDVRIARPTAGSFTRRRSIWG